MAYKTYKVRDIISHRSYSVRKCDIAYMEKEDIGTALVLKYPVRRGDCEFNRHAVVVTDRTLVRMGLAKRG